MEDGKWELENGESNPAVIWESPFRPGSGVRQTRQKAASGWARIRRASPTRMPTGGTVTRDRPVHTFVPWIVVSLSAPVSRFVPRGLVGRNAAGRLAGRWLASKHGTPDRCRSPHAARPRT